MAHAAAGHWRVGGSSRAPLPAYRDTDQAEAWTTVDKCTGWGANAACEEAAALAQRAGLHNNSQPYAQAHAPGWRLVRSARQVGVQWGGWATRGA